MRQEGVNAMSYCRWSDQQFECDIYAFAHMQGTYEVWVASQRHTSPAPKPTVPPFPVKGTEQQIEEWIEAENQFDKWMDGATLVPIGLPHDGAMFSFATPAEAAEKMEELRSVGYNVPQYAIDALREEAKEEEGNDRSD